VVLGAGPAGLALAARLSERSHFDVTVVERRAEVGGFAGSFELDGLRVDFGSHRLHPSCEAGILADIRRMLGDQLLDRPRHGRIRLRGRWVHFPLRPLDLARRLPLSFMAGVLKDTLVKRRNGRGEPSFASVLEQGLGHTICRDFYFPYAEKIWGMPPSELAAEQAYRRVAARSMAKIVRKVLGAVPGLKPPGQGRFYYPKHGYGQISDAYRQAATANGATILTDTDVTRVSVRDGVVYTVEIRHRHDDTTQELPVAHVLSTIPLPALVSLAHPAPPTDVLDAASKLTYRSMLLIYLTLETDRFTEFDAHYFPERRIPITRISEPKNYGLAGRSGLTVLCAELPCAQSDEVWGLGTDELSQLTLRALETAGLPVTAPVRAAHVRRLSHAYPIYTPDYRPNFDQLAKWVDAIDGLVTLGRQGLFAHDNTHHTLSMAYKLTDCLDDDGALDRAQWVAHLRSFESHVVED
jgi:protoporphyrinogen oxidase